MYKTFTITVTMPMSWYSKNAKTVRKWITTFRDAVLFAAGADVTVDIQESPDPTETDNITDLTKVTGFKG